MMQTNSHVPARNSGVGLSLSCNETNATKAGRSGNTVSRGLRDSFWLMSMSVGVKGAFDCIKAFSETDLTEDLKRIDVPTLIIHGDDDQIVPIGASALLSSKIVKDATLKIYPGAPHGLAQVPAYKDIFNNDLLTFIKA